MLENNLGAGASPIGEAGDFDLTGCLGKGAPLLSFSPDYEAVRQRLEEERRLSLDYLAEVVQR